MTTPDENSQAMEDNTEEVCSDQDVMNDSDETSSLSPNVQELARNPALEEPATIPSNSIGCNNIAQLTDPTIPPSSPDKPSQSAEEPDKTETDFVNEPYSPESLSLDFEENVLADDAFEPISILDSGEKNDEQIREAAAKESSLDTETDSEISVQQQNPAKPTSPKLLKAVINCVPQILPPHIRERLKSDECVQQIPPTGTRKRKLSKSSDSNKQKKLEQNLLTGHDVNRKLSHTHRLNHDSNFMMERSSEIDKSDKFYDIKQIVLHGTRQLSGANIPRFRQFSNILLKNWRFSKQFSGRTNARGKQNIHNTLEKIVTDLYKRQLIRIKGREDNIDIVKMIVGEIMRDNSRLFSQTPPSLTVLITTDLFDRYYNSTLPVGTGKKAGRSVGLGSASEQWFKLKEELGMETHEEVASALIHCYKAWTSVACGKCRRHMEVGMERKTGRSIMNSESSVCIVSCECGKNTSGGFMIECDVCHKWQHGFCVGVDKDSIPESYSCTWCRKIRGSVALEGTGEGDSDDSVVSIDNTELCSTDDSSPEVIELD